MLKQNDARYLTQGSLQQMLQLLGCKCFLEKMARDITYEGAKPAVEHLNRAVEDLDAVFKVCIDGIEQNQIDRLMRFNECHRLALVGECDPLIKKQPVIMDWEHVRVLVHALNTEVCTLCDRDCDGVRKCPVREAIYDMGGEPDTGNAKINEWCELSRGIL